MNVSIPVEYSPARDAFAGRTVLVTGAGGGLGRSVALGAARYGAEVILLGRTVRPLEAIHDLIVERGGSPPAIYPMDLAGASFDDYADLANRIDEAYGRLHGVVHAAASFPGLAPLAHLDPGDWLRTVHVNLTAPFLVTRTCLPLLQRVPDATLVFIGDSLGRRARAYWGVESRTGAPVLGSGGGSVAFAPGLSPAPMTTFPVPAHQTGRADLPHPAFGRDHAFALGKPIVFRVRRTRP